MKFVIAPDKFKGSLNGFEICDAIEEGLKMVFPEATILKTPLADGGDGTIDVVKHFLKADVIKVKVNNPVFKTIEAPYLYAKESKVAYIEMAEASGLNLLHKSEVNCMKTTSLGTGELIVDALNRGAKEIILGIGGSATNDAGIGMATALGYQFLDENGILVSPIGENLGKVKKINTKKVNQRLGEVSIKVACDVTNPFFGENGAAYVYAAQKGATNTNIVFLDNGLKSFAKVLNEHFKTDVQHVVGGGAAGGMGVGTHVFLNAKLKSGIDLIKEITQFEAQIKNANWIITGEGMLDGQTMAGKTINGVIESAKKQNIPVAAFCGAVEISTEEQEKLGLQYAVSITQGISDLNSAMLNSRENLIKTTYNFAKLLQTSNL